MKRVILTTLTTGLLLISIAGAADQIGYLINTTGESLSKINLETHIIENDILILGTDVWCYPNQIIIWDTLAYVINSGTNEIQIIDLNAEQTIDFINLPAGSNPFWMEFLDSQYVYISLLINNSLAKVDLVNKTVVSEVPVGNGPEGVVISQGKVFVANSAYNFSSGGYDPGTVSVYDPNTESVVNSISVDLNPQMMAVDDSGYVHVVCTGDYSSITGRINIIDPEAETVVADFAIGGYPGQISIGPDQIAYIAAPDWSYDSHIFTYHSITHEVFHDASDPITIGWNVNMVTAYQDSTCYAGCYDDTVHVIDSSGAVIHKYPAGDNPYGIDFNYLPGDVNGDFDVNLTDILNLISWIYVDGTPPRWPIWRANVNGDQTFNLEDILYLITSVYVDPNKRPIPSPRWVK